MKVLDSWLGKGVKKSNFFQKLWEGLVDPKDLKCWGWGSIHSEKKSSTCFFLIIGWFTLKFWGLKEEFCDEKNSFETSFHFKGVSQRQFGKVYILIFFLHPSLSLLHRCTFSLRLSVSGPTSTLYKLSQTFVETGTRQH